jgi:F0F1-type ATP synthase assembly protein I
MGKSIVKKIIRKECEIMADQHKDKKNENALSVWICVGVLVGVAFGCWTNNLGLCMALGLLGGAAVGVIIDSL